MRASVSHANLLSFSYNINGTISVCMCMCVHAWQDIWWINASTCAQVFCSCKPLIPGAPQDESESGLCHSSLAYLYPWPLCSGGTRWYTVSVYYNACCELIVVWLDDWRRMRGRYNPVCGTSRLDLMSLELFDIQRGTSVLATSHLSPVHLHHCH